MLLAAATLIPIGVLGFLALRILQQDRDLERQRARVSLEVAAGRLALDIERQFQRVEEKLGSGTGIPFSPSGLGTDPDFPLLYQPKLPPQAPVLDASIFQAAEAEEFQHHDLNAATTAYRRLTESHEPAVRAAALVRLGGVLRARDDRTAALQAYQDLAAAIVPRHKRMRPRP